jgi:hypothetical protein
MATLDEMKARHAREIAKATRELEIAEMLPDLGPLPRIVTQSDEHWLCYKANAWQDVLRVFDAFALAPAFDCKDRGSRTTSRAPRGEALGEYFAWFETSAYVDISPTASFRAFANMPDGAPIMLNVEFEGAYYRKGPWHSDLGARFVDMKPRATKYHEYRKEGPKFLAQAAAVVSYSTGRNDGGGGHWKGYFATRECLAAAIETLV